MAKVLHLYPYNGPDHVIRLPDDQAKRIFEAKQRGEKEIVIWDEQGNGAIIDLTAYRCIAVQGAYAGPPVIPHRDG